MRQFATCAGTLVFAASVVCLANVACAAADGESGEPRHWAFEPIQSPAVPIVREEALVRNPVDAFLLARLEEKGLTFASPAGKRELVRRVTYDLTGLPPTPEEITAFLNEDAADAYERLVDRLLESPHYGEHWGRYWLD